MGLLLNRGCNRGCSMVYFALLAAVWISPCHCLGASWSWRMVSLRQIIIQSKNVPHEFVNTAQNDTFHIFELFNDICGLYCSGDRIAGKERCLHSGPLPHACMWLYQDKGLVFSQLATAIFSLGPFCIWSIDNWGILINIPGMDNQHTTKNIWYVENDCNVLSSWRLFSLLAAV